MVDRDHVENQLRRDGQDVLAFEGQIDQRRRGGEPLVPAPERISHRALHDGGTDDGANDPRFARDQLVAHALRVGVDVRPAPRRRPLHALASHLRPDPLLARAGHRQLQGLLVVGIAVLFAQPLPRLLPQLRQHLGVVGQLADVGRLLGVVRHLLLDREHRPRQVLVPREIAVELLVLPHLARPIAGHEAGAGVNQRRPLHALGEGDDVLRPLDVGAQRRLQRRIEGHPPGRIDEDVDVLGHALGLLFAEAEVGLGDVAVDHLDLGGEEGGQPLRAAVPLAQGVEGRRGHHALPEPRLAVRPRAAADHDVDPSHLRVAVEQHAEQHLADEPGASEDEQVPTAEDLRDRQGRRGGLGGAGLHELHRGRFLAPSAEGRKLALPAGFADPPGRRRGLSSGTRGWRGSASRRRSRRRDRSARSWPDLRRRTVRSDRAALARWASRSPRGPARRTIRTPPCRRRCNTSRRRRTRLRNPLPACSSRQGPAHCNCRPGRRARPCSRRRWRNALDRRPPPDRRCRERSWWWACSLRRRPGHRRSEPHHHLPVALSWGTNRAYRPQPTATRPAAFAVVAASRRGRSLASTGGSRRGARWESDTGPYAARRRAGLTGRRAGSVAADPVDAEPAPAIGAGGASGRRADRDRRRRPSRPTPYRPRRCHCRQRLPHRAPRPCQPPTHRPHHRCRPESHRPRVPNRPRSRRSQSRASPTNPKSPTFLRQPNRPRP